MNFGADQNFGMPGANPSGDDLSRQLGQRLQASELRTAQTLGNMPFHAQPNQSSLEDTLKSIVSHIEVSDQRTAQAFQSIQQQMAQIATHPHITGQANSQAAHHLEDRMTNMVGQLQTGIAHNAQASSQLESQVSQLAQEYAQNPAGYDPESAQLKALDGQLQNLGMHPEHMDSQLGALAERINHNVSNGHDPNITALQDQVADLHNQLHSGQGQDPAYQSAIEQQLAGISQKLAETEQRLNSVSSLEAGFNDLSQRMGAAGGGDISENKNALKALNQALGALRQQAKASEEKTNETLEAVHDTLEKVIARIANLEQTAPEVIYRGARTQADPVISSLPEEFQQPNMAPPPSDFTPAEAIPAPSQMGMATPANIPPEPQKQGRAGAVSSSFIQAARRAAQDNIQGKPSADKNDQKSKTAKDKPAGKSRRRPLLMAAAAVLIVIGGLQTYKLTKSGKMNLPFIGKFIKKEGTAKTKAPATSQLGKQAEPKNGELDKGALSSKITREPDKPLPGKDTISGKPAPDKVPHTQTITSSAESPGAAIAKTTSPAASTKPVRVASNTATQTSTLSKKAPAPASRIATPVKTTKPQTLTPLPPLGSGYKELPASIGSESLRRAAASGNPEAQFAIATRYLNGEGVKKDTGKALIWYQRAAAKGLAPAQYRLGTFYEKGRGVKQDKMTARIWYERAAEQGNRKAMHNLAVIYADANNGKPDFTKAALWFRKASERDLTDSQFNMGILSERGLGVPKDLVDAYKWFAIAGAKGDKDSEARKTALGKQMQPRSLVLAKLAVDNWAPRPVKKSANVVDLNKKNWLSSSATANSRYIQRQLVAEAQSRLNRLGYRAGPPDGIMGRRTRDAIKKYQQSMGLKVTGTASTELIKHLRTKTG